MICATDFAEEIQAITGAHTFSALRSLSPSQVESMPNVQIRQKNIMGHGRKNNVVGNMVMACVAEYDDEISDRKGGNGDHIEPEQLIIWLSNGERQQGCCH